MRSFTPTRTASSTDGQQEGLVISVNVVPPVSLVPSQKRKTASSGRGARSSGVCLLTGEATGFRAQGVAVNEKEKCSLVDLSVPGAPKLV